MGDVTGMVRAPNAVEIISDCYQETLLASCFSLGNEDCASKSHCHAAHKATIPISPTPNCHFAELGVHLFLMPTVSSELSTAQS